MRAMLALLVLGGLATPLHARQQTDTTFAVEPGGKLRIDNHQGAVRVRSWDRAAMRVTAVHSSRIWIDIRHSAGGVRLEGEARRGPAHGIDYDVTVPRDYSMDVDCNNCDVMVEDVDGEIVVDNVQGAIIIHGGRGRLNVESVSGEINVSGARGDVRAENVNSGISLSDITGNVNAESVNGEIRLANITSDNVVAETVNGQIQYQGTLRNGGRYRLSTHNGEVRVAVPEDAGVDVSVSTHGGEVQADFPVQVRGAMEGGEVRFVIGNGGAQLAIEAFNGTIRLVRPR